MNWKDDHIKKLILFYSHNNLFLVPDFWYQKSCNWYQKLVPDSGTSFLLPVSGSSFWSVCHGHKCSRTPLCKGNIHNRHIHSLHWLPVHHHIQFKLGMCQISGSDWPYIPPIFAIQLRFRSGWNVECIGYRSRIFCCQYNSIRAWMS